MAHQGQISSLSLDNHATVPLHFFTEQSHQAGKCRNTDETSYLKGSKPLT